MAPAPNDDISVEPVSGDSSAPSDASSPLSNPDTGSAVEPAAPLSRVAIEQKLTAAGVNLRRGRADEARRDVDEVLAAQPRYAPAHEILGDVEAHLGRYAEACAAYRAALKLEPGRPTAELKLGRTALRATEAMGGFQTLSETRGAPRAGKGVAGFASAVLPGLGQIMRGAYVKGAVMLGVYCLSNFLILCLPETKDMLRDVSGLLAPNHSSGGGAQIGGLFWFLSFVSTIDWLYAVIDVALAKD
ncbi:hypothetical protein CCAX7_52930 [Capsulimonas corticalis]|uniref:Uncharacterized protein n=1 Tax=Capsulimonas corticalis TaxID=2219043 RepID=A0A402CP04_9BACT|nr:tetratricopeptide repeat protein [Capsulimonas corticalis]BDI33242.1 hypothetical protein CCAX7_52930 [Capsulimonas corticalis]